MLADSRPIMRTGASGVTLDVDKEQLIAAQFASGDRPTMRLLAGTPIGDSHLIAARPRSERARPIAEPMKIAEDGAPPKADIEPVMAREQV